MDLYRIIDDLVAERNRVQKIIESLELMAVPPDEAAPRSPTKKRGRKSMDGAARKEVSERMKLYWARRRGDEQKENAA